MFKKFFENLTGKNADKELEKDKKMTSDEKEFHQETMTQELKRFKDQQAPAGESPSNAVQHAGDLQQAGERPQAGENATTSYEQKPEQFKNNDAAPFPEETAILPPEQEAPEQKKNN